MTTFDPDSASEPDTGADQFPVVLRGYDRQLVDARVGELAGQLGQERRQRADAEQKLHQLDTGNVLAVRDQPTASFLSLGARAAKVFEEAGAVAERLIGEAQEQARLIIDAAQAEAAERLKAAEEQASELEQAARQTLGEAEAEQARIEAEPAEPAEPLLADAERDAGAARAAAQEEIRRAWQKADRERLLVEAKAQRLQTLRQILNEQLGQVHTHLGLALRATGDAAAGGSDPRSRSTTPSRPLEPSRPTATMTRRWRPNTPCRPRRWPPKLIEPAGASRHRRVQHSRPGSVVGCAGPVTPRRAWRDGVNHHRQQRELRQQRRHGNGHHARQTALGEGHHPPAEGWSWGRFCAVGHGRCAATPLRRRKQPPPARRHLWLSVAAPAPAAIPPPP